MDTDEIAQQPPDDSVVPWQPSEVREQLEMLRDYAPDNATPESTINLALTMLDNMACPHGDCPRLLLDHHDLS